jgi:hypothetical protein
MGFTRLLQIKLAIQSISAYFWNTNHYQMKKFLLLSFLLFTGLFLQAQPTIDQSTFVQVGDVFEYEQLIYDPMEDYALITAAGADTTWDFSALLTLDGQGATELYYPLDSTPDLFNLFFGNPFLAGENFSNLALSVSVLDFELPLPLQIENGFQFYRSDEEGYFITGNAAEVEGLPLISTYENLDRVYAFPLNYLDADTNDFDFFTEVPSIGAIGQEGTRRNLVDGWGQVLIPGGDSYNCLRVRTELEVTDTIYLEFTQTGTLVERPLQVIYTWISPELGGVVAEASFVEDVLISFRSLANISALSTSSVAEEPYFKVFPNPTSDAVQISIPNDLRASLTIFDLTGRIVRQHQLRGRESIDISSLSEGIYLFNLRSESITSTKRVVVKR